MKTIDFKCRTCGKSVHIAYDDGVIFNIDAWLPITICNRCADLRSTIAFCKDKIRTAAWYYQNEQRRKKQAPEVVKASREDVVKFTKMLARKVCDYYSTLFQWEPDFAEQCMEHPDQISQVVGAYVRMVKDKAKMRPGATVSV